MFYTERLCLRGFQPDDADKIQTMETDPRVAPSIILDFWRPPKPDYKEEIKKRHEKGLWSAVAVTRESNEFVGIVALGLMPDTPNRNPAVLIAVSPEQQSKGYGGEMLNFLLKHAFVELGMHRVWLQVLSENAAAISLYRRCGFVEEGRQRQHVWKNGKWTDLISMGILKKEWEELQRLET